MTARCLSTANVAVMLAFFLSLLHVGLCDFGYFKNKYGDLLEIKGESNIHYPGLSAIRHKDPDSDKNYMFIGYARVDKKKANVYGNVINMLPSGNRFAVELWANNLPLFPVQNLTSTSLSMLYNEVKSDAVPFRKFANRLHERPDDFANFLRGGQRQPPPPPDSRMQSRETDKMYMEGEDFVIVNGLEQPNKNGFIINKEDGSAIVGYFENGASKYHHKFQLNGQHEYYKQNVCSGNASEMTESMLKSKTKINKHSYSYYPNKIELCRLISADNHSSNAMLPFGDNWECLGSFHLGVLDGIGIAHVKAENKYIAGMWLLGHPTTPRIEVVESSFVFVGIADPSEYEEEAKFVRSLAGEGHKFTNELFKLADKVCKKYSKKDNGSKA